MKHIPYENWLQYVEDTLDEETRTQYENHMYSCDQCLELYLEAVENSPIQMPVLSSDSSFTDSIMTQLKESTKEKPKPAHQRKPKSFRKQTMIHYIVAAAMTLLLMSTGIFSQLMTVASAVEKSETEQQTSFVSNILNNTISITNQFEENLKEGDKK